MRICNKNISLLNYIMENPETTDINYLINSHKCNNEDNENYDSDSDNLINSQKNDELNNETNNIDSVSDDDFLKSFTKYNESINDKNENSNKQFENENHKQENNIDNDNDNNLFTNIKKNMDISDFKEILAGGGYEQLTEQQKKLAKLDLLMKMSELIKSQGILVTSEYTIDSDYYELKMEYDYHVGLRAKKKTIQMFYDGIVGGTKILEYLNSTFNPIGIDLDGWSLNLESSREELLDTLLELYDKYNTSGKPLSPEARLMFIIVKSAIMTVVLNMGKSFISSMFNKNIEITNEEKELLKQKINNPSTQNNINQKNLFNQLNETSKQNKEDIMDKYNKERTERNNDIQLTPPQIPTSLIPQQTH